MTAAFGEGVEVKDFTGYDIVESGEDIVGITISFQSATAIEANHPYLIKVTKAITAEEGFTVDGVDIDPDEEPTKQVGTKKAERGYFIGTYKANTAVPDEDLFISNDRFYYSNGSTKMKAFRGYFELADVLKSVEEAGASARINMIDVEPTSIANAKVNLNANDSYFNLAGQKVQNPKKGLYIKNNKKVVLK
jgi:hypothetical protein